MSKAAPQRERSEVQNEQQEVPHPRYEPTGEIEAKSGSDVVDPWIRGKYPITDAEGTEDGVIRTSVNFYAKQHDDGSGVFMSPRGSAVYAIRTRDGTVLGNERPWADVAVGVRNPRRKSKSTRTSVPVRRSGSN